MSRAFLDLVRHPLINYFVACSSGILTPSTLVIGGMLADAAANLPGIFGKTGILGFSWIENYPYALPSVIVSATLMLATAVVFFGLEEVSPWNPFVGEHTAD